VASTLSLSTTPTADSPNSHAQKACVRHRPV